MILTPHIPALDGTRHRDRNHGHYSNHDLGWQNLGRPHTKMSHIKGRDICSSMLFFLVL